MAKFKPELLIIRILQRPWKRGHLLAGLVVVLGDRVLERAVLGELVRGERFARLR